MNAERLVRFVTFHFVTRILRKHIGTIEGLEHIPAEGSFVLVPNHSSYFDHFTVGALIEAVRGTPTWFLTKRESFEKPLPRLWARAWYAIPVDRDAPSPGTIREVQRILASGDVLCVYPEGTRGPGDVLLPFRHGAFRFALTEDVPLIPLGMVGTNSVLPRGDTRFKPGKVHLVVGAPLEVPLTGTKQQKAEILALRARPLIERLITRAKQNAASTDHEHLARENAAVLDARITGSLSETSTLTRKTVARFMRLTRLLLVATPQNPDLRSQQIRLRGLAAMNAPAALQAVFAPSIRRDAEAILRQAPGHRDASYLLGRWHLMIPKILGGRLQDSIRYFEASALASEPGDTRALTGLADAYLACNDRENAIAALQAVIAGTPPDHPRSEPRRRKAQQKLTSLTSVTDSGSTLDQRPDQ